MKARVKGTTDIIEVEFDKDALNACYPPYHDKEHNMYYQPEQLEWVDNEVNAEPDYWTKLEHLYAGMAMHAILTHYRNAKLPAEYCSDEAEYYAKGLVKKYKKEANNG